MKNIEVGEVDKGQARHVRRDGYEPDCAFTFCPNKQGMGTWTDLTITGARVGVQPVCEQHWAALRFVPKSEPS